MDLVRFRLYLLHLAHSDLSHIAPTFWSNSSSGNKLSSWSNTSRNSRPAWRSYKQLIGDSSSFGEHLSSANLNPESQNPPQNHSPYPYLSSVTSPQTKNTTQHLPFTTFHQNPRVSTTTTTNRLLTLGSGTCQNGTAIGLKAFLQNLLRLRRSTELQKPQAEKPATSGIDDS